MFQKHFLVETCVIWKPTNSFAIHINWLVTMWYFFLLKGVSERTFALLLLTYTWTPYMNWPVHSYEELRFVGLVLLYYHLFEHVITFNFGYKSFIDLSCVSDLDILSSYFTLFIAWIADWTSQWKWSVTLIIIALITILNFFNPFAPWNPLCEF